MTATVVRPHVTVVVYRYGTGAVDLHITSTAGMDRWSRFAAGDDVPDLIVESYRDSGATIEEVER